MLTARIDRLEAEVRGTLQLASVIGRYFYQRVLAHIANLAADLDDQLLTLQRTQMIQVAARLPELEYIFRHALTQEAAYSTILLRQRRVFHGQVGESLESLFPDQREELAGSLARHFYLARDYPRALRYYTLAGDAAFRQFATAEAIDHYGKAIECSGKVEQTTSDQLVHLYAKRGRAYELANQFEAALGKLWTHGQTFSRSWRQGVAALFVNLPNVSSMARTPRFTILQRPKRWEKKRCGWPENLAIAPPKPGSCGRCYW